VYPVFLTVLYLYGMVKKNRESKKAALFIFFACFFSVVVNILSQQFFDKQRPIHELGIVDVDQETLLHHLLPLTSFPSDHAVVTFSIAMATWLISHKYRKMHLKIWSFFLFVFALFPSWLNSLPKSGGWMTTAKVFLGFLELAFALKFLSNADLVQHWGLLKREVFVGLWFVLFALLTLYLFGLIRFPHDEPRKPLLQYSKGRLIIGVLSAAFSIYLLLGLFGKNSLRVLSGFPPPESYAFFPKEHKNDQIVFKDYYEGMAYAKEHNMPVMLDFTGWACVNCRKMEEHVWTDPQVKELMKKYVLISLYVDDKEELPKDKQFDFKHRNGRVEYIKTIGDKWATFQEVNFSSASQPYYVLLSPNTELLSTPVQYVDVETYKEWLRKGVKND